MSVSRPTGYQQVVSVCSNIQVLLFDTHRDLPVSQHVVSVKSSSLLHLRFIYDFFAAHND